MLPVLAVLQVILSAGLITLVLMHSGRDTGLGGMGFAPTAIADPDTVALPLAKPTENIVVPSGRRPTTSAVRTPS